MVVVGFKMTENVSQMLNQSERQTEDQHYWLWITTGILTPSESKCDWLTRKNISVSSSFCTPCPHALLLSPAKQMPGSAFFASRKKHGGWSHPDYVRHTEDFPWLGAELEHSPGRQRLPLRVEDRAPRIWSYTLCSVTKQEDTSPPMATRGQGHAAEELGSQPKSSTDPHTISHHCRKGNSRNKEGFSISCMHTQTFSLSLFCVKWFFLTCICFTVFLRQKQERIDMLRHCASFQQLKIKIFLQRRAREGSLPQLGIENTHNKLLLSYTFLPEWVIKKVQRRVPLRDRAELVSSWSMGAEFRDCPDGRGDQVRCMTKPGWRPPTSGPAGLATLWESDTYQFPLLCMLPSLVYLCGSWRAGGTNFLPTCGCT